ncbi:MAG: hypothetical protein V4850_11655 [Myxococcota bacterium]
MAQVSPLLSTIIPYQASAVYPDTQPSRPEISVSSGNPLYDQTSSSARAGVVSRRHRSMKTSGPALSGIHTFGLFRGQEPGDATLSEREIPPPRLACDVDRLPA